MIKFMMPSYDEGSLESLYCNKYVESIIPEKQQILGNLSLHQEIIDFISEYRVLLNKIK
jgi:hypothetical protein